MNINSVADITLKSHLESLAIVTAEALDLPVERIRVEETTLRIPYWLCTHQELHTSRRIRTVFDFLADITDTVFDFTAEFRNG